MNERVKETINDAAQDTPEKLNLWYHNEFQSREGNKRILLIDSESIIITMAESVFFSEWMDGWKVYHLWVLS